MSSENSQTQCGNCSASTAKKLLSGRRHLPLCTLVLLGATFSLCSSCLLFNRLTAATKSEITGSPAAVAYAGTASSACRSTVVFQSPPLVAPLPNFDFLWHLPIVGQNNIRWRTTSWLRQSNIMRWRTVSVIVSRAFTFSIVII
jgi:hypothetical protein